MPPDDRPLYTVQIGRVPQKVMKRCPADLVRRLTDTIDRLAVDPRPPGCKKLAGVHDKWRVRVGDWRITYTIQDDVLIVVIVEVAPRGGAYRNL
jgi:mRNA interferase RelE/StbE